MEEILPDDLYGEIWDREFFNRCNEDITIVFSRQLFTHAVDNLGYIEQPKGVILWDSGKRKLVLDTTEFLKGMSALFSGGRLYRVG